MNKNLDEDILGELSSMEPDAKEFISSFDYDKWIFEEDIKVDMAHVVMLIEEDIIPKEEGIKILQILRNLKFSDLDRKEDVHVAKEDKLSELIGHETAGWLHTARSRNDEVATCIRMKLRNELLSLSKLLAEFIETIINFADENFETIMPGYTHLQHAEPTTIAHHFLSHAFSLSRDLDRILECLDRTNKSPLGSCAFTSTSFDINTNRTCELLGFDNVMENSIDASSSRDFLLESSSSINMLFINLSRISEELILWSTSEFNLVEIPSEFTSTSSIMPQKKNPDVLELIRAKSGGAIGSCVSISSILKALPYAYNRDLQEVTPHIWRAVSDCKNAVAMIDNIISDLEINENRLEKLASEGMTGATEIANFLVNERNIPFRKAHSIVAEFVEKELSIDKIAKELKIDSESLRNIIEPLRIVKNKNISFSPKPEMCMKQSKMLKEKLKNSKNDIEDRVESVKEAEKNLDELVLTYLGDEDEN